MPLRRRRFARDELAPNIGRDRLVPVSLAKPLHSPSPSGLFDAALHNSGTEPGLFAAGRGRGLVLPLILGHEG